MRLLTNARREEIRVNARLWLVCGDRSAFTERDLDDLLAEIDILYRSQRRALNLHRLDMLRRAGGPAAGTGELP